ncbi:MAG: hypothetical protein WDZ28_01280 [Simkaniaceae bacterium]
MKLKTYLSCLLAILIGAGIGKTLYSYRFNLEKEMKVPLLEKELAAAENQKLQPFLLIMHAEECSMGLRRALQSIENQEYQNFTLCILDESSSGAVGNIVEEFSKRTALNFQYIKGNHQELLIKAKGLIQNFDSEGLVMFVQGCDWLPHQNVIKMANHLQLKEHYSILFGQYVLYPSYIQGVKKQWVKRSVHRNRFPKSRSFLDCPKVFKASFLKKNEGLDYFILNKENVVKELMKRANKKNKFSRYVFSVKNKAKEDSDVLFDEWLDS